MNRLCYPLLITERLPFLPILRILDIFCLSLLVFLLSSCSTNQAEDSPLESQQHQWHELKSEYPINKPALKALLKSATLINNWKLMWSIELELCQIETETDAKLNACAKAKQLSLIFYQDPSLQFDTSLVLYQQFQQHQDLLTAEQFATTEMQKTDLLLTQGIVPTDMQQQLIEIGSLQEARLSYLLGKNTKNPLLLKKAAQLFWRHGQANKQADSLYLLSMLQWELGQSNEARSNAVKSLMLHTQNNNAIASKAIQRWLDEH